LKSEGKAVESSFEDEIINADNVFSACFRGSLEYEYLKKFRFKFEGESGDECNQLMLFLKYIDVGKKKIKNKRRSESLLKIYEKLKEKGLYGDDVEVIRLECLLDNRTELGQTQLERSFLKLAEQWSELMEIEIDILCRGREKGLRQSFGDLDETSMDRGFIKNKRAAVELFQVKSSF
jgi:hypothetical protein